MDSMHKIVLIEPVMIEECKRLYRENKNNFPGISGRVWILYDRNLSYTDKNPDIERYWLFDKGELIKDEPYKGSCFSQMNNKDFFLNPEIRFNILLEEGKALIAYYFGKRFTRCLEYDLICIDDKYSLCDMETVWVG